MNDNEPQPTRPKARYRPGIPRPKPKQAMARLNPGTDPLVSDLWPAEIPVGPRETAAIETFLGGLLDKLLGGRRAA